MIDPRPYHHGGLRAALLERAEQTLRTTGPSGLSLRGLAREVGVSHGAPRRHFADKSALLDALALEGWRRLRETLAAAASSGTELTERMVRVAVAYVRFATANPALLELMVAAKHDTAAAPEVQAAALGAFGDLQDLVVQGQAAGELRPGPAEQLGMVLFAQLQGITSLVNSQMVTAADAEALTVDAVQAVLRGLRPDPAVEVESSAAETPPSESVARSGRTTESSACRPVRLNEPPDSRA